MRRSFDGIDSDLHTAASKIHKLRIGIRSTLILVNILSMGNRKHFQIQYQYQTLSVSVSILLVQYTLKER